MRTQEEIVNHIKAAKSDLLGFESVELLRALDFEHAKSFFNSLKKKDWKPDLLTDEAVVKQVVDYMDFAIDKATGHRGISASRSIAHYRAWLWLIGDDKLVKFADDDDNNYQNYGAPILKKIARKYKAPLPKGHRGKVFNAMAKGEMCPDCASGMPSGCNRC